MLCKQIVVFSQPSLRWVYLGFAQGLTSSNTLGSGAAHAVFVLRSYIKWKGPKIRWCIKKALPTFFPSARAAGGPRPRGSRKAPAVSSWWALKLEGKGSSASPALTQVLWGENGRFGKLLRHDLTPGSDPTIPELTPFGARPRLFSWSLLDAELRAGWSLRWGCALVCIALPTSTKPFTSSSRWPRTLWQLWLGFPPRWKGDEVPP